jgi:hypothetical protein
MSHLPFQNGTFISLTFTHLLAVDDELKHVTAWDLQESRLVARLAEGLVVGRLKLIRVHSINRDHTQRKAATNASAEEQQTHRESLHPCLRNTGAQERQLRSHRQQHVHEWSARARRRRTLPAYTGHLHETHSGQSEMNRRSKRSPTRLCSATDWNVTQSDVLRTHAGGAYSMHDGLHGGCTFKE